MDLILVGLPGSGKSVVGRRIAHRHGAAFIDLDDAIVAAAGRSIADLFATEGEAVFRSLEAAAVEALGPADPDPALRRVIATGGGTIVDPRNRWHLYRGRTAVWLDARPEALAQRLRHSHIVRPLIGGGDPIGALRRLAAARERFYAPAHRVNALAEPASVSAAIDAIVTTGPTADHGSRLLVAETSIGRFSIGDGIAIDGVAEALGGLGAQRGILVSEPGAWSAVGAAIGDGLRARGIPFELIQLPSGEAAKRLAVVEGAARELARIRAERREPLVAIGGGALGDAAGLLAALWLRGVPVIHVPTTLVAQIDSSIGGKTAVDLAEGKNLLGAFHQPTDVIVDVSVTRSLPLRERRAALAEAVKMAALGDERLFSLLERDGATIVAAGDDAVASGAVAELVERALWAKVEVVLADERELGGEAADGVGRLALNLGHSAGHAVEVAGAYRELLHGEAVAYGLRVACRVGVAVGTTPPDRAARIGGLLDAIGLGIGRLPYRIDAVLDALGTDKKHAAGRLRWVLPTADGVVVRADIPADLVRRAIAEVLAPAADGAEAVGTARGADGR